MQASKPCARPLKASLLSRTTEYSKVTWSSSLSWAEMLSLPNIGTPYPITSFNGNSHKDHYSAGKQGQYQYGSSPGAHIQQLLAFARRGRYCLHVRLTVLTVVPSHRCPLCSIPHDLLFPQTQGTSDQESPASDCTTFECSSEFYIGFQYDYPLHSDD